MSIIYDVNDWFKITDTEEQLNIDCRYFVYSEFDDFVIGIFEFDGTALYNIEDENDFLTIGELNEGEEYWAMDFEFPMCPIIE